MVLANITDLEALGLGLLAISLLAVLIVLGICLFLGLIKYDRCYCRHHTVEWSYEKHPDSWWVWQHHDSHDAAVEQIRKIEEDKYHSDAFKYRIRCE